MGERQTLDDVTASIMQQPNDEPSVEEVVEEIVEEVDEEIVDEDPVGEADDYEDVDEDVDDSPLEGEDEEDDEEVTSDSEPYLDVTDEDLIEVKVDGEVVYRTVGDAKKALSGEGAIDKRLKEATEFKKQTSHDYDRGVRELEARRTQIVEVVQQLDQYLFVPQVAAPTEELRAQDPQRYLQHLDAYNADQARLKTARSTLQENLQGQMQRKEQSMQELRQRNEARLIERIPELKDAEQQPKIMNTIVEVGRSYGFNDQEIAALFDDRAYKMAYDLAQLQRKGKGKKVTKITPENDNTTRVPRRLRSGVAQRMAKSRNAKKVKAATVDRARETGKVDDIVATILKPGKRR